MKTNIAIIALLFVLAGNIYGQQGDLVKTQGISSPLHETNIGKIRFSSKPVLLADLKDNDFLNSYELTNNSDLYITVFLKNSLTNYMHFVAPEMSRDELVRSGNYQFSLLIDNNLIYKSNLWPGAPRPRTQDTATVLTTPLINNHNDGGWLWSQSFWQRFMNNGGDSVLTDGTHLLKMEIRPYVQTPAGIKTGDIIAGGELNLIVKRIPEIDLSVIKLSKVLPYSGFKVSNEKFNKDKIKELKGNIAAGVFKKISSVIVIKNGKLLIEEYFNGETRDSLHDPRSAGKSFSSTITGIAESEGYLKSEDQKLKDFYNINSYENYTTQKEDVSIKDLLTMSSAFDGNDDDGSSPGNEENMYPTADWVKFTLDLPVNPIWQGKWHYFTAGVVLLGDILNKSVPGGLEKYADNKLFKPLGIHNYRWEYTPQNVPNTAGGIRMNALDFAKYGQLYKNRGKWDGKQIIPENWIDKTFTKYKAIEGRKDEFYGYLFWNKKYIVKGKAYETFYCAGNGGNKIYIFQDQPLVIVITATAYGAPYAHSQEDKMMTDYILPAVINSGHK